MLHWVADWSQVEVEVEVEDEEEELIEEDEPPNLSKNGSAKSIPRLHSEVFFGRYLFVAFWCFLAISTSRLARV